jgi:hypothetical protein
MYNSKECADKGPDLLPAIRPIVRAGCFMVLVCASVLPEDIGNHAVEGKAEGEFIADAACQKCVRDRNGIRAGAEVRRDAGKSRAFEKVLPGTGGIDGVPGKTRCRP